MGLQKKFRHILLICAIGAGAGFIQGCSNCGRCSKQKIAVSAEAYSLSDESGLKAGLIRIVPIKPPDGDYPAGTKLDTDLGKITFPPGTGPTTVWLSVELSGWGSNGLREYDLLLNVGDSICPREPCNCMVGVSSIDCIDDDDCPDGSTCVSLTCEPVYMQSSDSNFVFSGKDYSPDVTSSHPNYSIGAILDKHEVPKKDEGHAFIGATMMLSASDACAKMAYALVDFSATAPPSFLLGDNTRVYPHHVGATIINEP